MKKMFIVILAGLLVVCIAYMTRYYQQPVVLNEDYINSEVLNGTEYVDEILFVNETDNYVACFCSVKDEELMLLILENDEFYNMYFRHSFSLKDLTNNPYTIMTDDVLFTNSKISYNIFLNPSDTAVQIKGISHKVDIIRYSTNKKEYEIGFWWFENRGQE